jgi:hypothetical protein
MTLDGGIMRRFLTFFAVPLLIISSFATQYYVKNGGNDSLDGKSDANAWATVSFALTNGWGADATISLKCGSVFREKATIPSAGTSGHPKTINSYDTGAKPQILGSDQLTGWTVYNGNVWQSSHMGTIYQVWFTQASDSKIHWGTLKTSANACTSEYDWYYARNVVYCYSPSDPGTRYTTVEGSARANCISGSKAYITIDGVEAAYSYQIGIWFDGNTATYGIVKNCTIHHIGQAPGGTNGHGVRMTGSYGLIQSNTIHNCATHGTWIHPKNGQTCVNCIVESNTVYDCYHASIDIWCYFATGTSSGHIARYNKVYSTSDYAAPTVSCGGIQLHAENSGANLDACQIYYNLIYNMMGMALTINAHSGTTITNPVIENNTCYKTNASCPATISDGIELSLGVSGAIIKNNIAVDWKDGCLKVIGSGSQVATCDYNCWYQSNGTDRTVYRNGTSYLNSEYGTYTAATGWDTHTPTGGSAFVDPVFVSTTNFHLQATSPCRDKGVAIPGLTRDIDNNVVPFAGLPDMGAYEYQGTGGEPEIPPLSPPEEFLIRIMKEGAVLRLMPNNDSSVLMNLPLGAMFDIEEVSGEWIKIKLPPNESGITVTGFINESFVTYEKKKKKWLR